VATKDHDYTHPVQSIIPSNPMELDTSSFATFTFGNMENFKCPYCTESGFDSYNLAGKNQSYNSNGIGDSVDLAS
jgi:hypothetical protein